MKRSNKPKRLQKPKREFPEDKRDSRKGNPHAKPKKR